MVAHTSNLSTQEIDAGKFLQVQVWLGLYNKFQDSQSYMEKSCLKTQTKPTNKHKTDNGYSNVVCNHVTEL